MDTLRAGPRTGAGSLGDEMPVNAYPKELTDGYWKKVEKAIKVSDTGVGQHLRNAEKLYKILATKVTEQEKGSDVRLPDTKKAATAFANALEAAEKLFAAEYKKFAAKGKKFETSPEMKQLDRYRKAVTGVAHDAERIGTERTLAQGVGNFNDRVTMWAKFIAKA